MTTYPVRRHAISSMLGLLDPLFRATSRLTSQARCNFYLKAIRGLLPGRGMATEQIPRNLPIAPVFYCSVAALGFASLDLEHPRRAIEGGTNY